MVDVVRLVDGVAARVRQLYPDDARRARIVVAAVEAVEALGPAAGLAKVAERAGIPRPHLYRHFASKEQLDAEVVRVAAIDLGDRLRAHLAAGSTPEAAVRAAVGAAADWAEENPQLYRFIATPAPAGSEALGRGRFVGEVRAALQHYATTGEAPADVALDVPETVIAGVLGLVEATLIWWLDHRSEEREVVLDRLARQITLIFRAEARDSRTARD